MYEDHQSGKVILLMPATFSEKKDVKYGEDSFDTLTAGATQFMLSNMGGVLGGGALLGGAQALAGGGLNLNSVGGAMKAQQQQELFLQQVRWQEMHLVKH